LPTKITFYGGVNEVGGNKILLSDKDTTILLDFGKPFLPAAAAPLPSQKSSSFLLYIIMLIITFITTLTVLLSARHVHEIGILARQLDESIVMKLTMTSSKKGMRGYTERENRCGGLYYRFPTTLLWH
jgi:hypothetical protein